MQPWLNFLTDLSHLANKQGHRQVIVLAGEQAWAWEKIEGWLNNYQNNALISHHAPNSIQGIRLKTNKPNALLGYESQNIVFNGHEGLYPDALTAISGTLMAGGIFFLLCPPLKEWPDYSDDFSNKRSPYSNEITPKIVNNHHTVKRLIDKAQRHNAYILEQQFEQHSKPDTGKSNRDSIAPNKIQNGNWQAPDGLTSDQEQALSEVKTTFVNNQHFCHVISADRGRGKSHLLGKLILLHKNQNVDNGIKYYICAPTKAATQSIYKAMSTSEQATSPATATFLAPENVLTTVKPSDILIIDEAASLPIGFLIECSNTFNSVIFASTTHGYEGTGKGFQIRFFKHLNSPTCKHTPQYHTLNAPVRYASNDPLESWLFDAFCLASEPSTSLPETIENQPHFEFLSQTALANDNALLQEVFGLLIQAHYQTRPSDLRDILDAPDFKLFGLFSQPKEHPKTLLSVCLISLEGPITDIENQPSIQKAILQGQRRPKGHLMPQVLSHHMAIQGALDLKGARIVRIATVPNLQNMNFASLLITKVAQTLHNQGIDYLGSSFANTSDVSAFWEKNNFDTVRVGSKQDGASGTHSAMVIRGLSPSGIALQQEALGHFKNSQKPITNKEELSYTQIRQLTLFTQFMGSYESAKQILSRCHAFPYSFPKKANQEFKHKVKEWLSHF